MVHLVTVGGQFHARVLAARLGADGVLTELRGALGTTYPLAGEVEVYVEEAQAATAAALLMADLSSAKPAGPPAAEAPGRIRRGRTAWMLVALLVLLTVAASLHSAL